MRRLFLPAMLLLAGCSTFVGPFGRRQPERVDDPRLTISEQERRGRDRLALPQESPTIAPPVSGFPGTYGRESGRQ